MRYLIAITTVLSLAGCGGGGNITSPLPTTPTPSYAGVWIIQDAGLPNDQMLIDDSGNVMVQASAIRAETVRYKIGECDNTGHVTVAGAWPLGNGFSRHISGTAAISGSSLTLSATTTTNDVSETVVVNGYVLDAPPPVPYGNPDINVYEDLDIPPPVPY